MDHHSVLDQIITIQDNHAAYYTACSIIHTRGCSPPNSSPASNQAFVVVSGDALDVSGQPTGDTAGTSELHLRVLLICPQGTATHLPRTPPGNISPVILHNEEELI